ncbi:hypothetical protein ACFPRL_33330 [Pseudoclavibacter helvolus]
MVARLMVISCIRQAYARPYDRTAGATARVTSRTCALEFSTSDPIPST